MVWKMFSYEFSAFGLIFFSCEIGQRFTNLFEEITGRFDQLKWYLFPIHVQRLLPAVLINVQEPMVIGCFGIMAGSRDQFKKVKNKIIASKLFRIG